MSTNRTYKLAVLAGDGIGPEVIHEALKVLTKVCDKYKINIETQHGLIGACAIDETGEPFPSSTENLCLQSDAILLGAIGDPKYDNNPEAVVRPEQGLLKMRKTLQLFANVRPVSVFEELVHLSVFKKEALQNIDFVIFRELTGGIYFGEKTKTDTYASDLCTYYDFEVERIAHKAFELAMKRRKKLTLVDKANVLETSRLWRKEVQRISHQYPEVEVDYLFIDNAAMQIILRPQQFDVLLCDNLFGDILSDEASVLAGSLGLLPSASYGLHRALYEPIHGSYPQAKGKDIANPMATILSLEMMLIDWGYIAASEDIRNAIQLAIRNNVVTEDLKPLVAYKCSEVGSYIASKI